MIYSNRFGAKFTVALVACLVCAAMCPAQDVDSEPVGETAPFIANRPQDTEAGLSESEPRSASTTEPDRSGGIWPSKKLLGLLLTRYVDGACDRYDLDDGQRDAVRDATIDRWTELLTEHRSELEPLVNEFLEMRFGLEPPDEEQVKAWSDRANKSFEVVRGQIEETWDGFRDVLTPMQRPRFELETLAARAGLDIAAHKLGQWREGSFETTELWEPREKTAKREARQERRARRANRRERIKAETEAAQGDQVDQELGRWEQYVADFINRYHLDDGQRTAAMSLLTEVNARASAHRDRYSDEIATLEQRIENANDDDSDRGSIKQELLRLYGPIDELFAELERRLEPIPTKAQRVAAGDVEEKSETAPTPSTHNESTLPPISPDTKQIDKPSKSDGGN